MLEEHNNYIQKSPKIFYDENYRKLLNSFLAHIYKITLG